MSTKTSRQRRLHGHCSSRRLFKKLSASETLSKELVAKAFFRPANLVDSSSPLINETYETSHSSFESAPTIQRDQFAESLASISIDNGLSSPTRRAISSPRRSPRRTISSSPCKRKKPRYPKSTRLGDSCPDFESMRCKPLSLSSSNTFTTDSECPPEKDNALGEETMNHIKSYKEYFQQHRPNRRKVKFESSEAKRSSSSDGHIREISVSDLNLPQGQARPLGLSRREEFEIIQELERNIRTSTRQQDRLEEMIEYESEISQELERNNQILRRRIIAFPVSLPSKRELNDQIKVAEAILRNHKQTRTMLSKRSKRNIEKAEGAAAM